MMFRSRPNWRSSGELYRLRVENADYGSVALSMDGGRRYTLIGRVTRPASSVSVEREARTAGTVLRSSGEGLAFAVNLGQALKLQPGIAPTASVQARLAYHIQSRRRKHPHQPRAANRHLRQI